MHATVNLVNCGSQEYRSTFTCLSAYTQVCVHPSQAWHLPFSPLYNVLHHINHIISGGPRGSGMPLGSGLCGSRFQIWKNLNLHPWTNFSLYSITFTTTMRIQPALERKLCWKNWRIYDFLCRWFNHFCLCMFHYSTCIIGTSIGARSLLRCLACSPIIRSILVPPYKKQSA